MHNYRLLSTKLLTQNQQRRLIDTGVSLTSWNFITTQPKALEFTIPKKGLIFTSQNAVKAIEKQLFKRQNNCYCVGNKTKKLLEENGQKVIKVAKNAALLAEFLIHQCTNESFVFYTGNHRMTEIEDAFEQYNRSLKVVEVYTTIAQPKVVGEFDGILFFSPSGVESYLQKNTLKNVLCFAIGNTTAKALQPHIQDIITASQPTVEHLIATVKKHLSTP